MSQNDFRELVGVKGGRSGLGAFARGGVNGTPQVRRSKQRSELHRQERSGSSRKLAGGRSENLRPKRLTYRATTFSVALFGISEYH
jgi:hypothetical protein